MPARLRAWLERVPARIQHQLDRTPHGELRRWRDTVAGLPAVRATEVDLDSSIIRIGTANDCDPDTRCSIEQSLRALHPWRKGPFLIHDILIDTEWRSDMKWARLCDAIHPLDGRWVLDVGCGNGYHCWRMAGCGARGVIGIDPTLLSVMQFQAIRHFVGTGVPVEVLPVGIESVPRGLNAFDSVFSMGVLYHRRSPLDHLLELRDCLRPGGELILETLVIDGPPGQTLVPPGRYAKMRNVWFIPAPATLIAWLERCGFTRVRLIDVSRTTTHEQRATDWMRFQSLPDFLDPNDPGRTCEGHPAPQRAIFLAERP